MSRAIDDPVKLAKAARIVRGAMARKAAADDRIKKIVDAAPPLTADQRHRLAGYARELAESWPPFSAEQRTKIASILAPYAKAVSVDAVQPRRRATRSRPKRQQHPADIAAAKLLELIAEQKAKRVNGERADEVVREAMRLVDKGVAAEDVMANAKAISEARRVGFIGDQFPISEEA